MKVASASDGRSERRALLAGAACALLLALSPATGHAADKDPLVEKLVEKGVLTTSEAEALRPGEKGKKPSSWWERFSVGGDIRLRYQAEDRDGSDKRNRARIRYRLSVDGKPAEDVTVGLRLASGSSDPRSTNQTLQDTFASKDIFIDRAFVKYRPVKWVTLAGGKIGNPLFTPSDLLWDTDINPEGAAITLSGKVGAWLSPFLNTGVFVLDERSTGSDPLMYAIQAGVKWAFSDTGELTVAAAYYGFSSLQGKVLEFSPGSNTLAPGGGLQFDYNTVAVSAEAGFGVPIPFLPYATVFAEYVTNPDPSDDEIGYIGGVQVGSRKIKRLGDWQASYSYRRLERDAWPDVFPDSDFFGGETHVKGHEAILNVGLASFATLGLDYYSAERIATGVSEDLLQVDLVLKF